MGRAPGPRPTPWSASSAEATTPVWLRLCRLVGQVENLRAGWQPALLWTRLTTRFLLSAARCWVCGSAALRGGQLCPQPAMGQLILACSRLFRRLLSPAASGANPYSIKNYLDDVLVMVPRRMRRLHIRGEWLPRRELERDYPDARRRNQDFSVTLAVAGSSRLPLQDIRTLK